MRERLLELAGRWVDTTTAASHKPSAEKLAAMIDAEGAFRRAVATLDDSAGVDAYRDALQKIADGEVESRYARDDLARALYQIEAVREFAKDALAARLTTGDA